MMSIQAYVGPFGREVNLKLTPSISYTKILMELTVKINFIYSCRHKMKEEC